MYKYSQPLFWGPFVTKTMAKPKAKPNGGHLVMKTKKMVKPKGGPFVTKVLTKLRGDSL